MGDLETRILEIETEFKVKQKQMESLMKAVEQTKAELYRLQGRYDEVTGNEKRSGMVDDMGDNIVADTM